MRGFGSLAGFMFVFRGPPAFNVLVVLGCVLVLLGLSVVVLVVSFVCFCFGLAFWRLFFLARVLFGSPLVFPGLNFFGIFVFCSVFFVGFGVFWVSVFCCGAPCFFNKIVVTV